MLTSIHLQRLELITKEKMDSYCKGEEYLKDSVNDDLESLFENIRLGKKSEIFVRTYFLPKLTEEELELIERRDTSYLQTFFDWFINKENPDVPETEMMLSKSDSKYVRGRAQRRTFVIENSSETSSELSPGRSSECSYGNFDNYASQHEQLYRFENSSELSSDNSFETLEENPSENKSCFKNCCNCTLQ